MSVPELGKARHLPIDKLQPGMKVHRDVLGRKNKVLVAAGEILTAKHCSQLQKWESKEKPQGPSLAKINPKDRTERVRRAEFEGGWRPSHFNQNGVLVSATLASGEESPAVERDPMLSPVIQKNFKEQRSGLSVSIPFGEESEQWKRRNMREEITNLETINAQLNGDLHKQAYPSETLEECMLRRDALLEDNQRLISELKSDKGNGNGHTAKTASSPGRKKAGR